MMKLTLTSPSVLPRGIPEPRLRQFLRDARRIKERERLRIRAEIQRIPGLMALLMKPRNGEAWTAQDRVQLKKQLQGLGVLGLYAFTLVFPGTTITLPILAWWLDRRRYRGYPLSADNADTGITLPNR